MFQGRIINFLNDLRVEWIVDVHDHQPMIGRDECMRAGDNDIVGIVQRSAGIKALFPYFFGSSMRVR